jgi:hypothetical protein
MLSAVDWIGIGTRELINVSKGPSVSSHVWRDDGYGDYIFQTLEFAGDQSSVGPWACIGDVEMITTCRCGWWSVKARWRNLKHDVLVLSVIQVCGLRLIDAMMDQDEQKHKHLPFSGSNSPPFSMVSRKEEGLRLKLPLLSILEREMSDWFETSRWDWDAIVLNWYDSCFWVKMSIGFCCLELYAMLCSGLRMTLSKGNERGWVEYAFDLEGLYTRDSADWLNNLRRDADSRDPSDTRGSRRPSVITGTQRAFKSCWSSNQLLLPFLW